MNLRLIVADRINQVYYEGLKNLLQLDIIYILLKLSKNVPLNLTDGVNNLSYFSLKSKLFREILLIKGRVFRLNMIRLSLTLFRKVGIETWYSLWNSMNTPDLEEHLRRIDKLGEKLVRINPSL